MKYNRSKGMTLTEVIMAAALLVTALIPILKGLTGAYQAGLKIEEKTQSLAAAQSKLNEIKVLCLLAYDRAYGGQGVWQDTYLYRITDQALTGDLRTIKVETGRDKDGDKQVDAGEISIVLETLVARRTPQ